jgi:phage baseplate assembly protein V
MKLGCELKYGIVTNVQPGKGLAKVHFDDIDIESDFLPYLSNRTSGDTENDPLEKDDHVACLMDCNLENGVILGCIYSEADVPPAESGANKWVKKFADGTIFKYDKQAHEYSVTNGTISFVINRSGGFNIYKGSEDLGKLNKDLAQECATMTMPVSGATAGPPTNAANIVAIISRMNTFFKP